jgi:hypothetical protein
MPSSSLQSYIYGQHATLNKTSGAAAFDKLLSSLPGGFGLIVDAESGRAIAAAERCDESEDFALIEDVSLATARQMALGYPKDSEHRARFDALILSYFADGTMGRLRQKWFKPCTIDESIDRNMKQAEGRRKQPTPFGKMRLQEML